MSGQQCLIESDEVELPDYRSAAGALSSEFPKRKFRFEP
jgi:hypothetical protein